MKPSIFLPVVGEEVSGVYNNCEFAEGENAELSAVFTDSEVHSKPKMYKTFARHGHFHLHAKKLMKPEQHATELKKRCKTCYFGELAETLIRFRIFCGITVNGLQ